MGGNDKKKGNRERMRDAIKGHAGKPQPAKLPSKVAGYLLAAAANGKPVEKRVNPRSAPARDARAKARGRLPMGAQFSCEYHGSKWSGSIKIYWPNENLAHRITHEADGLFRLMEELDIKFWQWIADNADMIDQLPWPSEDYKPEPMPKEMKS